MMKICTCGMLLAAALISCGCGPAALRTGNPLPPLQAAGWTNGSPPSAMDLSSKVIVLEAFATW